MQKEIDHLKRSLRHKRKKRAPSNSDYSFDDEKDEDYRQRSMTPPSESFSYEEDHRHKRSNSSSKGLVNDAMSKALNRISKSPFTSWIEERRLLQRFIQPTFTLYNGRTDPVEYVSHFNQKMAIYSKNEALMCKVFPFSVGPAAMRWFDV